VLSGEIRVPAWPSGSGRPPCRRRFGLGRESARRCGRFTQTGCGIVQAGVREDRPLVLGRNSVSGNRRSHSSSRSNASSRNPKVTKTSALSLTLLKAQTCNNLLRARSSPASTSLQGHCPISAAGQVPISPASLRMSVMQASSAVEGFQRVRGQFGGASMRSSCPV